MQLISAQQSSIEKNIYHSAVSCLTSGWVYTHAEQQVQRNIKISYYEYHVPFGNISNCIGKLMP